jgi:hypothetical protein
MRQYLRTATGKRLVFGTGHDELPIACLPKEPKHCRKLGVPHVSVRLNNQDIATVSIVDEGGKFHLFNIQHDHSKKFWLLAAI